MLKKVRNMTIILLMLCICLLVCDLTIASNLIIIEHSVTYLFCAVCICISSLICISVMKRYYSERKMGSLIMISFISLFTIFSCITLVEICHRLHKNPQFYAVEIENSPDEYEVELYEYKSFRGVSGCLTFKLNDYVHKVISDTRYETDNITLSDSNNLQLEYNEKIDTLIMKYRSYENGNFYEVTITNFCDKKD